jgi:hypothetical protein
MVSLLKEFNAEYEIHNKDGRKPLDFGDDALRTCLTLSKGLSFFNQAMKVSSLFSKKHNKSLNFYALSNYRKLLAINSIQQDIEIYF